MAKFGEIYLAKIYFKGNTGAFKYRPLLIIDDSDINLFTVAEVTGVEPDDPPKYYDQFKVEIAGWKIAGLDKPSWVKCHKGNIRRIPKNKLTRYIGKVADKDLVSIIDKIVNQ